MKRLKLRPLDHPFLIVLLLMMIIFFVFVTLFFVQPTSAHISLAECGSVLRRWDSCPLSCRRVDP